jgi:hypothetical protein
MQNNARGKKFPRFRQTVVIPRITIDGGWSAGLRSADVVI